MRWAMRAFWYPHNFFFYKKLESNLTRCLFFPYAGRSHLVSPVKLL
jgi:hypothetical protein